MTVETGRMKTAVSYISITAVAVVACSVLSAYVRIIRSTPASRPNNIRGGNVRPSLGPRGLRPSVRPYVRTSVHKKFVRFQ